LEGTFPATQEDERFDRSRRFASRRELRDARFEGNRKTHPRCGQAMQSSVAEGISSPVEQARQHSADRGDRSSARPKKDIRKKLEARCSSAGEVTGRENKVNASTASVEDKTAERNLRVTSPAWLKGRHSTECGDFVHESRAGTGEPKEVGSRSKRLAEGAKAALERGQRQRLRSKTWSPKDDGRSADGLAAGAVESRSRGFHRRPGRDARSERDWKWHRGLSGKAKKNRCD